MNSTLSYGDTDIVQDVYVSRTLTQPLLGWPAIKGMGIFSHLSNVEAVERYRLMFPALFIGLGKLEQECHIESTPDAQPHCLYASRRDPLPLQEAVIAELQRMQDEDVISAVTRPTDWCSGMVVVRKKMVKLEFVWITQH